MNEIEKLSIEEVVDLLKDTRDKQKKLKDIEDALKKRILDDGREEIKSETHTMKIQIRSKEVFNQEAFMEAFSKDDQFNNELKSFIIENKPVLNEANLNEAVKDERIPLDYVIPFNTVTESKVITVK